MPGFESDLLTPDAEVANWDTLQEASYGNWNTDDVPIPEPQFTSEAWAEPDQPQSVAEAITGQPQPEYAQPATDVFSDASASAPESAMYPQGDPVAPEAFGPPSPDYQEPAAYDPFQQMQYQPEDIGNGEPPYQPIPSFDPSSAEGMAPEWRNLLEQDYYGGQPDYGADLFPPMPGSEVGNRYDYDQRGNISGLAPEWKDAIASGYRLYPNDATAAESYAAAVFNNGGPVQGGIVSGLSAKDQVAKARDAFGALGLPPSLADIAPARDIDGTTGYYSAEQRAKLGPITFPRIPFVPGTGQDERISLPPSSNANTAMHEALHAFEESLSPEKKLELYGLMQQNPPPVNMFSEHHPLDTKGALGLNTYLDPKTYGEEPTPFSGVQPPNEWGISEPSTPVPQPDYGPTGFPPAILQFIQDNAPLTKEPKVPGSPFFNNPNFAESNAQFDATTNPENRGGVGILGGIQNVLSAANDLRTGVIDPALKFGQETFAQPFENAGNLLGGYGMTAPGASGFSGAPSDGTIAGGIADFAAKSLFPGNTVDLAALAFGDTAVEKGLEGLGAARRALTSADEVLPLEKLPAAAIRGAEGRFPEAPGVGADIASTIRRIAGGAPDITPEDAARYWANLGKKVPDAAEEVVAPITDLKGEIRTALNLGPEGAPKDVLDEATEQVLKLADNGPPPVAGAQPDLFGGGQQFMPAAEGAARYEWEKVPELDVPLSQLKLIKAAQENPSVSTLTSLVEDIFKGKAGQIGLGLDAATVDSRSLWDRAIDEAIALTGLPRELKASFDQSIPGRQGLALAFRHPLEWIDSWKTVLPSMGSEDGFKLVNQDAQNWITKWSQRVGDGVVHLNTIDRNAPGTERIAGFEAGSKGFVGRVSKALGTEKFERSAVAFINHQRAKTMDTMFTSLWEAATPAERQTPEFAKQFRNLAAIIDHATGYGGAFLKGDLASRLFFSQRFMTSRFQFLADTVTEGLIRGDTKAARAAMENLTAFAGGTATILALMDMGAEKAGVDALNVEWDPRSSDFGKIRVGPARIDFGAGFLPLIRSAAQIGTGKKKTLTGDIVPIQKFDQETFKKESAVKASGNVALSFFRNKLDPVAGEIATRAIVGKDSVGKDPTPILSFSTLGNMFMPLMASSVQENLKNGGNPASAAAVGASELFGGSASTYGAGQAAQQDTAQQQYGANYGELPAVYQAQINAGIPDIQIGDRLAPWWQARDDALEYYKTQIGESQNDPRILAAKEATSYQDLGIRLQRVYENEYGLTRAQAEAEVTKTLKSMVGDNIDAYREDVMSKDPGFAKSWLDAYNKRQTKYEPPKWVKDLAGQ